MKVYLVGTGTGSADCLTERARAVIDNADIVIGAKRMTEGIENKIIFNSYNSDEIAGYLSNKKVGSAAVLLSGDVGFYSGAKKLLDTLNGYEVELIPGISSLVYFCARLKMPWEDIRLLSMHGKSCNAINYIKKYKRVFLLLSGSESIRELCKKLCYYNMGNVRLYIGQRLSYPDESITCAKAEDIKDFSFDSLSVVLAENPHPMDLSHSSIPDDEFIRGEVPMTKSEIRCISLAKLGLSENSVLYDIGAGTGSVSVEAALKLTDGKVYAIERNEKALGLIEENKRKFAADNIEIIEGKAPAVLDTLPAPTHVFIGGSGGNMLEIIESCFNKNPTVKIVINAVSLNTLCEVNNIIEQKDFNAEVICVNTARDRMLGSYRLMTGLNPVYVITIGGIKND